MIKMKINKDIFKYFLKVINIKYRKNQYGFNQLTITLLLHKKTTYKTDLIYSVLLYSTPFYSVSIIILYLLFLYSTFISFLKIFINYYIYLHSDHEALKVNVICLMHFLWRKSFKLYLILLMWTIFSIVFLKNKSEYYIRCSEVNLTNSIFFSEIQVMTWLSRTFFYIYTVLMNYHGL